MEIFAVHCLNNLLLSFRATKVSAWCMYTQAAKMACHASVHVQVNSLSGGERRRLQLAAVLVEKPNLLILDEPTNDLDLQTVEVVEELLSDYKGCLLVVSHDRAFMENLADRLFVVSGDGLVRLYDGLYSEVSHCHARTFTLSCTPVSVLPGYEEPAPLSHYESFPCGAILSVPHLYNSIFLLMQRQANMPYNTYKAAS